MNRNAFTLIELLVVIAIVAILISIITPAMRAAKKQARTVICSSNQAQLALKLSMYDNDNSSFPYGFNDQNTAIPPGGGVGNIVDDRLGWWWFHYIQDTTDKKSDLWCPSRKFSDLSIKANILCGNYGINRSVCKDSSGLVGNLGNEFVGKSLSMGHIRQPSQVLLLTDSGYSQVSWRAATNAVSPHFNNPRREINFYIPGMEINKSRPLTAGSFTEAITGRHPKRTVNVIFVDGHLERIKADELTVSITSGVYKNLSLWKP
ncbi:MAG: type II secretion system protein [Planctomycetes bacterium]|nr:type II secretion system protein [Planctomycetota bacterium]